jgi:hypothetical protein
MPAQAQFSSSGAVNVFPGNAAVPNGAGNADLGNVGLFVGNGALGSFSALGAVFCVWARYRSAPVERATATAPC